MNSDKKRKIDETLPTEDTEKKDDFNLLEFQKKAIWVKMREYKAQNETNLLKIQNISEKNNKLIKQNEKYRLTLEMLQSICRKVLGREVDLANEENNVDKMLKMITGLDSENFKELLEEIKEGVTVSVEVKENSASVAELNKDIEGMKEDISNLQRKYNRLLLENEKLKQKKNNNPVAENKNENESLENKDLIIELDYLKKQNEMFMNEIEALKKVKVDLMTKSEELKDETQEKRSNDSYERQKDVIKQLRRNIDDCKDRLAKEYDKRHDYIRRLQRENAEKLDDAIKLVQGHDSQDIKMAKELEKAKIELKELRNKYEYLKKKNEEFSKLNTIMGHYDSCLKRINADLSESEWMAEIENMAKAFEEMQEHNEKLEKQLLQKEDLILQLLGEKVKVDQGHNLLEKERQLFQETVSHWRKKEVTLNESLKKLKKKELDLESEKTRLDKEIALRYEGAESMKWKYNNEVLKSNELTSKLEKLSGKMDNLQKSFKEKLVQYEKDVLYRKKFEDECKMLRKKIQVIKGESSEDFDEIAAYKKLLYCSACEIRQKGVIITRCMHLFCKECIDDRLDSRQRKCPSCGEGFGQNDVKPVYL
ncbi:hypothetical protein ROZALSC1DRAFT_29598 [Rozella allomycis CSF55]|uniref:E3 ubiquitin protein ligase n=1 Tax=Rozella allomycis (strain CSF55) TaxID=988480 RepID=A0A075B175_ROZAC|nr:Zinc finger, RING-type domain-containing protein [Rozella allomycis CSF55]RKP18750.1 hypothetical protein ROZALSC1DRAFT_29598 [Rozella allomycis CSF55]|eukprot:EPZ34706.1 Zinc finger, RING-type domain-containing protein [Rozella allomycis CSF55]